MKKISYIDPKKLKTALRKHEKLIEENPILKEELALLENWHKEEKRRRDLTYNRKIAEAQKSQRRV